MADPDPASIDSVMVTPELLDHLATLGCRAVMAMASGDQATAMHYLGQLPTQPRVLHAYASSMGDLMRCTYGDTAHVHAMHRGPDGTVSARPLDEAPLYLRTAIRFLLAYMAGDQDAADLQFRLVLDEGVPGDLGGFIWTVTAQAAQAIPTIDATLVRQASLN